MARDYLAQRRDITFDAVKYRPKEKAIAQRTLKQLCGWWRYVGFLSGAIIVVVEDVDLRLGCIKSAQSTFLNKTTGEKSEVYLFDAHYQSYRRTQEP
jgi:hypothetical protein